MSERSYLLSPGNPVILANPAANVLPGEATPNYVSEWRGVARPIEVSLYAEGAGQVYQYPTSLRAAYAGINNIAQNPPIPAYFEIKYGCGGIVRRRIVDLYTARVFLGVCDSVEITAYRWRGSQAGWGVMAFDLQVNATIGEAVGGSYDELQQTQMTLAPAAAALNQVFSAPSGAYAWQAGLFDGLLAAPLWGTAQPDIYFFSGGEEVVYRISNYQILPSVRRFKPPFNGSMFASSNGVALGARSVGIAVTWFLNS